MTRYTRKTTVSRGDNSSLPPLSANSVSYEITDGFTEQEVINRLGELEDLIERGDAINPDFALNDTIYFIWKDTVVLDGEIKNIYITLESDGNYTYNFRAVNLLYGVEVFLSARDNGIKWFKDENSANNYLKNVEN